MVKKQGAKNKKKGATLDEVFGEGASLGTGGWQTNVSAMEMMLDEEQIQPENTAAEADMIEVDPQQTTKDKCKGKGKKSRNGSIAGSMDTSEAYQQSEQQLKPGSVTRIPGLGVVTHSMKRGDRTTSQKKRKAEKLAKALARSEKMGVRINSKTQRKQTKNGLKHIY